MKITMRNETFFEEKKAVEWLKRNRCDIEGYSDIDCPRCGKKLMRRDKQKNPLSIENVRVCRLCKIDEERRKLSGEDKEQKEETPIRRFFF